MRVEMERWARKEKKEKGGSWRGEEGLERENARAVFQWLWFSLLL